MDVFKVEVSTESITHDRYVLQDENHISKVKERLQKMLSKLLIQVQNCTSGHELLSAESHLSSASHILQLAENNTNSLKLANKSTCPANKLAEAQRFHSTRKRRKRATTRLTKPSTEEKRSVMTYLIQDKFLYVDNNSSGCSSINKGKGYRITVKS